MYRTMPNARMVAPGRVDPNDIVLGMPLKKDHGIVTVINTRTFFHNNQTITLPQVVQQYEIQKPILISSEIHLAGEAPDFAKI